MGSRKAIVAIHRPVTCLRRKAACSGGGVLTTEAFERVIPIDHEAT